MLMLCTHLATLWRNRHLYGVNLREVFFFLKIFSFLPFCLLSRKESNHTIDQAASCTACVRASFCPVLLCAMIWLYSCMIPSLEYRSSLLNVGSRICPVRAVDETFQKRKNMIKHDEIRNMRQLHITVCGKHLSL